MILTSDISADFNDDDDDDKGYDNDLSFSLLRLLCYPEAYSFRSFGNILAI